MLPQIEEFEAEKLCLEDVGADVEFLTFLEAFGSEDAGSVVQHAVPSYSAQHHPLKSSENDLQDYGSMFVVSKGGNDGHLLAHVAANDVLPDKRPLRTDKDAQLQRTREKNRRSQKAYRKRQKELHAAVESASQQVDEARAKWRGLQKYRTSLQQRVNAALQHSLDQLNTAPTHKESSECAAVSGLNDDMTARKLALDNLQSHNFQLVPRTVRKSQFAANFSPFSSLQSSYVPQGLSGQFTRPVTSFSSFEQISFAAVSAFMAPQKGSTQEYNPLNHAIAAYQQSVSARTGVAVSDICWIIQWTVPESGPALSYSSSASSPECALCASTCYVISALEALFLVVEHETLLEASNHLYEPPTHPSLDSSEPPLTPPTPPDPAVLRTAFIRCGLNQMIPLQLAIDRAVKPLLAQYRERLQKCHWRAVCMHYMHITRAVIEVLGAQAEASKPSQADSGVMKGQGMGWGALSAAIMAAHQCVLCSLHSALHEPTNTALFGAQAQGRSLSEVEQRMLEVRGTSYMSMTLFLQAAPITARRLVSIQFLSQGQNTLRASRLNVKLYKQLQLQPDQRACMVERWRGWRRRRVALGHHLATTLAHFDESCPQHTYALDALMTHATLVATGREQGIQCQQSHAEHALHHDIRRSTIEHQDSCRIGVSIGKESENGKAAGQHSSVLACMPTECNDCPIIKNVSWLSDALGVSAAKSHDSEVISASDACVRPSATAEQCTLPSLPDSWQKCSQSADLYHEESVQDCNPQEAMLEHSVAVRERDGCTNEACSPCKAEEMSPVGTHHCAQQSAVACDQQNTSQVSLKEYNLSEEEPTVHSELIAAKSQKLNEVMEPPRAACRPCVLCGFPSAIESPSEESGTIHEKHDAWAPCIVCGAGKRPLLLGESADVTQRMHDALESFLDVHTSDALMHFEFIGPFRELTVRQQALLMASAIDLGLPTPDVVALWQSAAEEERREELFGHLSMLFV